MNCYVNERNGKDQTKIKPVKWNITVMKANNMENKALPLG